MEIILTNLVGLLIVAVIVALIARRLELPYTVGLVVTGIVLALTRSGTGPVLTHELIFDLILPPLLFEAAIHIPWGVLRRDALPVLTLALLGTVVAAVAVAAGMIFLLGWPAPSALLFGVLIAATDPVAVIAMFKDNGVKGRLRLLVESESLFNDGVAAVLFTLVLGWAQAADGEPAGLAEAGRSLALIVGGGIAAGFAVWGLAIAVIGRTSDHLLESTLTAVAAYGSFLLAEHLHCSGVLATVTAGLLMGNFGGEGRRFSMRGREFISDLWEFIAFIANSLVFLLIGLSVAGVPFDRFGAVSLAVVIGLVLFGRALTVYPLCGLFARSRWAIPLGEQHILWWGGLRGALALALALSLPASLAYRDEILVAAFGVVVFSVVLQGLTMPPLLRKLGFLSTRP